MRKIIISLFTIVFSLALKAQDINDKVKTEYNDHANDHLMLQLTSDQWLNAPDSISSRLKSNSRGGAIYVMINKPFQSNKHISVAFGLGIGSSNVYTDKMSVDITANTPVLSFTSLDSLNYFKKYKVSTSYLEIPVELRYFSKPSNPNKSVKAAIGVKVGTLLNAHTKGKTLYSKAGTKIQDYSDKLNSKSYFNSTRLAVTARVGYGNFSLFGSYNLTPIFKDKVAANMSLLQVGLNLSGL